MEKTTAESFTTAKKSGIITVDKFDTFVADQTKDFIGVQLSVLGVNQDFFFDLATESRNEFF